MEQLINKIEAIIEKQIADFEAKPLATSIKLLVFLWVFKYIYREVRGIK